MARLSVKFNDVPITQRSYAPEFQSMGDIQRRALEQAMANLSKIQTLQLGTGGQVFRADRQGIWLGAERFEDAPFRVDMQGNITAASLTVDAVQEVKDNITSLSDLSADLGSITAGTITGAEIFGSKISTDVAGNLRMRMNGDSNSYEFLSTSGVVLAELKSLAIPFTGMAGAALRHGTGTVLLGVSGPGEGMGPREASFSNIDGTVTLGIYDTDGLDYFIVARGLPTTNPGGSNRIWNDGGTLKIT